MGSDRGIRGDGVRCPDDREVNAYCLVGIFQSGERDFRNLADVDSIELDCRILFESQAKSFMYTINARRRLTRPRLHQEVDQHARSPWRRRCMAPTRSRPSYFFGETA